MRVKQRVPKEKAMKKAKAKTTARHVDNDTMRAEYDFSKAARGVTAARYAEGTNVVVLDSDVAEIFPNARAVNDDRYIVRSPVRPNRGFARTQGRKTVNRLTR